MNSFSLQSAVILMVFYVASSHGVSLNCTFKEHSSYWGQKYACVVENLTTSETNRIVTEVKGNHIDGKTNDDVVKVFVQHQYCPYLPINLGTFFKNLEILYVLKSNVSHLTNDDLTGLTKLKLFDVSHNPIERLHHDFFKGHDTIEIISFYDCKLTFIDKGSLSPLVHLKEGHFQGNPCIDFRGDDESLLPALIREVHQNCQDKQGMRHNINVTMDATHLFDYHEPSYNDYEEYGDSNWGFSDMDEFILHHGIDAAASTTDKAPTSTTKTEAPAESDSFIHRHAVLIIIFLVVVVTGLAGFLYKINAFNRHNWR